MAEDETGRTGQARAIDRTTNRSHDIDGLTTALSTRKETYRSSP